MSSMLNDVIGKEYTFKDIEITARVSKQSIKESVNKQEENYGRILYAYQHMEEISQKAKAIKIQDDRHTKDGYSDTENVHVMMAVIDGKDGIIPVKVEIKENKANNNSTHLMITLSIIKKEAGVIAGPNVDKLQDGQAHSTSSTYNLQDIVEKINTSDRDLLKYFPDNNLNAEQKESKREALIREANYDKEHKRIAEQEKQERIKEINKHYDSYLNQDREQTVTDKGDSIIAIIRVNKDGEVVVDNTMVSAFQTQKGYEQQFLNNETKIKYTKNNKDIKQLLAIRRRVPETIGA